MVTWEEFIDKFNRVHNPDYYYGFKKKKKTKKKKNGYSKSAKRFPVFKVQS